MLRNLRFDPLITIAPIIIVLFGAVTFYLTDNGGALIAQKQIILLALGLAVYFMMSYVDYRIYKNNSAVAIFVYLISTVALLLTFLAPEIRGTQLWLTLIGLSFQPAEIVKLALLILLAKYFSQKHVEIYRIQHILASGFYTLVPAFLMIIQSDIGSMVVVVALWIAILVFSGINKKHLLAILILGIAVSSVSWFAVLKTYQKERLLSFFNPYADPSESGYNTIQAQTTLGSGKIFGTYLTKNENSVSVLVPEPYNDFTFSAFGQKFGILGVLMLMALMSALMWRIGNITSKANNNFAKLFGLGFISIIFVHFTINAGMNLGILPITGIPFPFLSNGGSYLVVLMAGLGVVNNIKALS